MISINGTSLGKNTVTSYNNYFVCNHCKKIVSGGEYILGVFYCPMCASIIHRNNGESKELIIPIVYPVGLPTDKRIFY